LYTDFDREIPEDVRTAFRDHVRRRAAGEPVAYLVGHREFFSLAFTVTRDVLIPRPETEHLVVELLDLIKQREKGDRSNLPERPQGCCAQIGPVPFFTRIADVGTGSGAIAVAVAKHAPACRLTACDVSPAALAVARGNAERHQVADRIEFQASDLLSALPAEPQFNFIASNPPYVSQSEWERLPSDIKNYEPRLALVGGPSGTETMARLIPQAAERLRPGGWLLMEIGPTVEAAVRQLVTQDGHFESPQVLKDLAGLPRVLKARRRADENVSA
jgi:release factor glutamine methyltransferase